MSSLYKRWHTNSAIHSVLNKTLLLYPTHITKKFLIITAMLADCYFVSFLVLFQHSASVWQRLLNSAGHIQISSWYIKAMVTHNCAFVGVRGQLKCDGTRAETRFRLSAKLRIPFKSAGVSVQSTTGNRGVRISGSNAGYTKFRGSVKGTGYTLHSPVSTLLPLPRVTVCHHISAGVYQGFSI